MITLATLPNATTQEVADQISLHLLKQNKKSINVENSECLYRHKDLKCAAGCLISKKEYSHKMEGQGWMSLVIAGLVPDNNESIINYLQSIHDECPTQEWLEEIYKIYNEFELNTNLLPNKE